MPGEIPRERTEDSESSSEKLDHNWETEIILQRHGRYDNRFPESFVPGQQSEEENQTLGRMTPEGKAESREIARERIKQAMEEAGDNTDFLVVASPTFWVDIETFGQRAIETGEIISEEVLRVLEEAGLPHNQLLNLSGNFHGDSVRPSDKLVESQMFINQEVTNFLRQKYSGQGREFWDAYNADADRELRYGKGTPETTGAGETVFKPVEGSPEAADRMNRAMNILARAANQYHHEHPGRKLVIFVVSHHEAIEPYIQRGLGVEPKKFEPAVNEGVIIKIDSEGKGDTKIADEDIDVDFVRHGMPDKIS